MKPFSLLNLLSSCVSTFIAIGFAVAAPGTSATPPIFGKSVINSNFGGDWYQNFAKGFGSFTLGSNTLNNFNDDGYPVGTLVSDYAGNVQLPGSYYGHYTTSWTGVATFQIGSGYPVIVYSGGAGVYGITPSATGTYLGGINFVNQRNQPTGMNVEWTAGVLLTSVGVSGQGLVQVRVVAGTALNVATGTTIKFSTNVTGLGIAPNADGSWTVNHIDNNTITLQGSAGVAGGVSIISKGGPGIQSEGIIAFPGGANNNTSIGFPHAIPIYGAQNYAFSNFIWCQTPNLASVQAGNVINQTAIDFLKAIKPKYMRFMDAMAAQATYSNYNFRARPTSLTYSVKHFFSGLNGGTTGGSGDAFTATNPSASGGGAYQDGEAVQVTTNRANTTTFPTLNVGGRGASQIFSVNMLPLSMPASGSITNGDVISIVFGASYFSGSSYTFTYKVNTATTTIAGSITGSVLTVTAVSGNTITVGQMPFNSGSPANVVIQSQISGTTGGVGTYQLSGLSQISSVTTVTGGIGVPDTNLSFMNGNIATALQNDATLAPNGFIFGNSGGLSAYYPTSAGPLTVTSSTSGAATEILTPTRVAVGAIGSGQTYTFIYNALMGGWINSGDSLWTGVPLEVIYEICKRANIGAWLNVPVIYTQASIQSLGAAFATNMPGLPVAVEYGNEMWNGFLLPASQVTSMGVAAGFFGAAGADTSRASFSFAGLREAQLLPAFAASYVAAGGSRSNVTLLIQNGVLDGYTASQSNGSMQPYTWDGGLLTPTPASFTGSISGTTLTVTGTSGLIYAGMTLNGAGVTAGTKIVGSNPIAVQNHGNGSYIVSISQTVSSTAMTITNPVYSSFSGPGGTTSSTAYNTFPTRPIDFADSIGYAVYYQGALAGPGVGWWSGTASDFNTLFQASKDYAQGVATSNQTLITSALNAWSNDVRNGTKGAATIGQAGSTIQSYINPNTGIGPVGPIIGFENFAAQYDGARPGGKANLSVYQYEGGLQQSLSGSVGDTGTTNNTSIAQSPIDLNTQFVANGGSWATLDATYGYPSFGAGSTVTATNIVKLYLAYVNSTQFYNDQLYLWQQAKAIHAARPVFAPAQFGIEGVATSGATGAPIWGMFPGDLSTTPLQNYNAEQFYNLN